MLSPLEEILQQKIAQYDSMSRHEQLAKLEQILLVYAHGDVHVVEGMKLTYFAIVSYVGNPSQRDGAKVHLLEINTVLWYDR